MQSFPAGTRLARRLRELREGWPGGALTQLTLAQALSTDKPVGAATVSSWESLSNPKLPPRARLMAYARFFATVRSLDPRPHLVPDHDLTATEEILRQQLEQELLDLHADADPANRQEAPAVRRTWQFQDNASLTIVCPDAPPEVRGPLADPTDPNYTELYTYADLDALMELHGHIRAENPQMFVQFVVASKAQPDHLSSHVVLLGGVAWNALVSRLLAALPNLPIRQVEDPAVPTGEVFIVEDPDAAARRRFSPVWLDQPGGELLEDVGWLARFPNPFNRSRTLTVCNGVHSRGVMGAVRCLTDANVRDANENYLAKRFPDPDTFAVLLRVPVVGGQALSPDLQNGEHRLYEWPEATA